jgi:intraflagellar transport protein 140
VSLTARIALVDRFVLARKLAKTDTAQMVDVCMQLLDQRDAETAIRIGDVYALLVYFHQQALNFTKAHELIEAMRARAINIDPFVDAAAVASIYAAAGKQLPVKPPVTPPPEDEVHEEIE